MKREGLDNLSFAREIGRFNAEKGSKGVYNKNSISRWRTGRSTPPTHIIDSLAIFAFERGYELSFYISPLKEAHS